MKFFLSTLLALALVSGLPGCAKSGAGMGKQRPHYVQAGTQTGSNLPRRWEIDSGNDQSKAKRKKTRPKEDPDFVPRGGFR